MIARNDIDSDSLVSQSIQMLCKFSVGECFTIKCQIPGQKKNVRVKLLCLPNQGIEEHIRLVDHLSVPLRNGTHEKITAFIQARSTVMQVRRDHDSMAGGCRERLKCCEKKQKTADSLFHKITFSAHVQFGPVQ